MEREYKLTRRRRPAYFLTGCLLSVLVFIQAHFEPEMLPHKIASSQLRGFRLQYHISSDIDGGVQVSVHERPGCIDDG